MIPPTADELLKVLDTIDWYGHIEISELDKRWLATQISLHLSRPKSGKLCDSCGCWQPLTVKTRLGRMCESCLDEAAEIVEHNREELEHR